MFIESRFQRSPAGPIEIYCHGGISKRQTPRSWSGGGILSLMQPNCHNTLNLTTECQPRREKHCIFHIICTPMDVLENAIPGGSDFTTWQTRSVDKLAVAETRRPSKAMLMSHISWANASHLGTFVRMNPCRNINIKRFSGHVSLFTALAKVSCVPWSIIWLCNWHKG